MVSKEDCTNFRLAAEQTGEGALTGALKEHYDACEGCRAWLQQSQEILAMVSSMPQFDVSEQLTQRIVSSVAAQPARARSTDLLAPVSIVAAAVLCTVLPIDSLEGLASTAIGIIALFGVQLLIKSAGTEEMAY